MAAKSVSGTIVDYVYIRTFTCLVHIWFALASKVYFDNFVKCREMFYDWDCGRNDYHITDSAAYMASVMFENACIGAVGKGDYGSYGGCFGCRTF